MPRLAGALLAAWLVHELGHWLALAALGFRGRLGSFCGLGLAVELPAGCQGWRETVAALAGPAANLVWLGVAAGFGWERLWGASLVLAAVNLLPFLPLDGGRALRGLLGGWFSWLGASRLLLLLGRSLAIAWLGVIYWFGLARWLALGAVWVFLLAWLEERRLGLLLGARLAACLGQRGRPRRRLRLGREEQPLYRVVERLSPGWRNQVLWRGQRLEGDELVGAWLAGRGREPIGAFAQGERESHN